MSNIFEINMENIFRDMVSIWEDTTGETLERQDAERLMIQIFSGTIYDYGSSFLAASDQLFLDGMTGDQLDAYGDFDDVPRLVSTASVSTIRFTFDSAIRVSQVIYENTSATGANDNGTYLFKVLEDVLIPVGATSIDIAVEEYLTAGGNSGADANGIEIGAMTALDESQYTYSFVSSISNVVESHAGQASEEDDAYRERLKLAAQKHTTAGTAEAYKYFARSASANIADVGVTKENWTIKLWILPKDFDGGFNPVILGDGAEQLDNLVLAGLDMANTDTGKLYWSLSDVASTRTFAIYKDDAKGSGDKVAEYVGADGTTVAIVQANGSGITGTVDLAYTTDDTDTSNEIETSLISVGAVDATFNPATGNSPTRPLNDIVEVDLITKVDFEITQITIKTEDTGSIPSVTIEAERVANQFIDSLKNKADYNVVRSQLNAALSDIDGVYKVSSEFDSDADLDEVVIDGESVAIGTVSASNISVAVKENN